MSRNHCPTRVGVAWRGFTRRFGLMFAAAIIGLSSNAPSQAATVTVSSVADNGPGTLRQAFSSASSGDTIVFDPALDGQTIALTTYSNEAGCVTSNALSCSGASVPGRQFGPSAFFLTGGKTLTIDATANGLLRGISLVRSSTANFRFFDIDADSALTIRGLVLKDGAAVGGSSQSGGGSLGAGGAIFNRGVLEIDRCTLWGNLAKGGNTGIAGIGPFGGGGVGSSYPGMCPYCGVFGGTPNGGYVGSNGSMDPPFDAFPGKDGGLGGGGGRGGTSAQISGDGYLGAGGRGGNGGFGGGGGGGGGGYPAGEGGNGGFGGGGGQSSSSSAAGGIGGFGGIAATFQQSGPGAAFGGAIFNDAGSVLISQSTLTANSAQGGSGSLGSTRNGAALGGAIFNYNGTISLDFVTFAGNLVTKGPTGISGTLDGGAIYSLGDSPAACSAGGNPCNSTGARVDMRRSVAAGSSYPGSGYTNDIVTTAINGGGNSFTDQDNWIQKWSGNSLVRADPMLSTLAANGGFGLTMLPNIGSPIIDMAPLGCQSGAVTDQRGFQRLQGAACDLGAVEVRQVYFGVTVIGLGSISADTTPAPLTGGIIHCDGSTFAGCEAYYLAEYDAPTVIVTADSLANSTFMGWNGDCTGTGNSTSVTLDTDHRCDATFALTFEVSATITGNNGEISPALQQVLKGTPAVIKIVPNPGYHVSSIFSTCGGQLISTTYTTSPIVSNCAIEAMLSPDPVISLVIGACQVVDTECINDSHTRIGSLQTYVITAENQGNAPAPDAIISADSPDLDEAETTWTCAALNGASCTQSGKGPLTDNNLALPSNGILTWIVNTRVRMDAPSPRLDYVVALTRTSDPVIYSSVVSSTLVLHRDGFDSNQSENPINEPQHE